MEEGTEGKMNCDQRKDLIFLYAADQLDPAERDELRQHLAEGCPLCAGALAEAEAMLAQVAAAQPVVSPPPGALKKILEKVGADRAVHSAGSRHSTGSPWKIVATALLTAAASVAITAAIFWHFTRGAVHALQASDLSLVSLASQTQPSAHGRVLWDRDHNRWHLAIFDLKPPPPGKTYELWFITTDGAKVRADTFDPDASGTVMVSVAVPPNLGAIKMAAVTDEPAGGVPQPTGTIQLAGQVP
jgi:anti-sigma-K factor RskA